MQRLVLLRKDELRSRMRCDIVNFIFEHLVAFLMGTMVGIWWAQQKRPEALASDLVVYGGRYKI